MKDKLVYIGRVGNLKWASTIHFELLPDRSFIASLVILCTIPYTTARWLSIQAILRIGT
jgi:hypothetical protein